MLEVSRAYEEPITVDYLTGYMSLHLVPLLNALHAHPKVDLRAYYCSPDPRGIDDEITPNHPYVLSRRKAWSWLHPEFYLDLSVYGFLRQRTADITLVSEGDIPTLRLATRRLYRQGAVWALRGERPRLWYPSLGRLLLGVWVRRMPLSRTPAVIANGSWSARIYDELVPWDSLTYSVPYYVDPPTFQSRACRAIDTVDSAIGSELDEDDFCFLYVGALTELKGVHKLARAYNRVVERLPNTILLVVGDGPLRTRMEKVFSAKARAASIFLGSVTERSRLVSLYHTAQTFVFPTQYDGWGMVVNEALCCGLPVITTASCGAAHDLIVEGENGFVVDRNDIEGLSARMLQLAADPKLAARMGKTARETMVQHTPAIGAERMYQVCSDIIARARER